MDDDLNPGQRVVMDILTHQARLGDPVQVQTIRERALPFGVRYDTVNSALTWLVATGRAHKPSRGFYLPGSPNTEETR